MLKEILQIEGYWYSKSEYKYPKPIPNILSNKESKDIYELIKIIEDKCNNDVNKNQGYYINNYMGFSKSRITNERLGNREYITPKYKFPEDFGKHYVLEHGVKPSDDFLTYIGYLKKI